MAQPQKVIIIGGGVAGLTAAHELKERSFRVTVYERGDVFGGKARSNVIKPGRAEKDIVDLPSEHGFRFFPGFYQHVIDTLRRIPAGTPSGKRAVSNLVEVREGAIAQANKPFSLFPTKSLQGIGDGLRFLRELFANPSLGLGVGEAAFAALKVATAMTTCDERREAELDDITWWDYMCADEMSEQYVKVVVNGLTQNFVAMDAKKSSLRTVITILARLFQDFVSGRGLDRVLNGPTSEVWINPWVDYLKSSVSGQFPVDFCPNKCVDAFSFDAENSRISGLRFAKGDPVLDPDAIYLAAVPVEALIPILKNSPHAILEHSPTLKLLCEEHLQVNWMSGILYYLKSDAQMVPGHINYLDSGWAITSISQNQFWVKNVQSYGRGKVQGIVSAIISDWFKPGNGGVSSKCARDSDSGDEVAKEALAEIRAHLRAEPDIDLSDSNIIDHYLDADIIFDRPTLQAITGLRPAADFVRILGELRKKRILKVKENLEPLFINTVGSWRYRPSGVTDIMNLMLASDYVRTNTDLATMEGANESGRRAVNRILDLLHSRARRCRIFEFDEPLLFAPLKALDRYFFKLGMPHPALFGVCQRSKKRNSLTELEGRKHDERGKTPPKKSARAK